MEGKKSNTHHGLLTPMNRPRHREASASRLLKKEVIQPHVPVRLPCYDFVTVASLILGNCFLPRQVSPLTSGAASSHGVTGGVYKARERIHRSMADLRLLATPTSCRRFQPAIRTEDDFLGLAPDRSLATHCIIHCSVCVAQGIKAVLT